MASVPSFIATGRVAIVNVAAANTALDGSGTITPLIAGALSGTRITTITVKSAATSVAAVVNLFLSTDGGITWKLFESMLVTAITPSTTAMSFRTSATFDDLILPDANFVIGVTTTIAQSTNVYVLGGDL